MKKKIQSGFCFAILMFLIFTLLPVGTMAKETFTDNLSIQNGHCSTDKQS